MISLENAYTLWHEEVNYSIEANGINKAHAFFDTAKEILIENGDVLDLNYSPYISGNERVFDFDGNEVYLNEGYHLWSRSGRLADRTSSC